VSHFIQASLLCGSFIHFTFGVDRSYTDKSIAHLSDTVSLPIYLASTDEPKFPESPSKTFSLCMYCIRTTEGNQSVKTCRRISDQMSYFAYKNL